jgi:putative PIN family toxin of toxin-antitoxin system
VLISAMLCSEGPSAQIVQGATSGDLNACYDGTILAEYEGVMRRPRFEIEPERLTKVLANIVMFGVPVAVEPIAVPLPDRTDEVFLQAAIAGQAECLITGNKKHFPERCCQGVLVLSPRAFLAYYESRRRV